MTSNSYIIFHSVDGDNHDFNVLQIPTDLMLGLSNTLRLEFNTRIAAETAPSFREERAKQHERHLKYCQDNSQTPQQQFIDFPL